MPTDKEIKEAIDCLGSLSAVELRKKIINSSLKNGLYEKLMEAACMDDDDEIEVGEPDKIDKESAQKLWEAGKKVKDLSAGVDLFEDDTKIERSDD